MKSKPYLLVLLSLVLLQCHSFATEVAKDGVYIAVEGNLLFVLTLDERSPAGDQLAMFHLKDGVWRSVEQTGHLKRADGRITGMDITFVVETTSGPGYSSQRLVQTEQSFMTLSNAPKKINRVYSLIQALNFK